MNVANLSCFSVVVPKFESPWSASSDVTCPRGTSLARTLSAISLEADRRIRVHSASAYPRVCGGDFPGSQDVCVYTIIFDHELNEIQKFL